MDENIQVADDATKNVTSDFGLVDLFDVDGTSQPVQPTDPKTVDDQPLKDWSEKDKSEIKQFTDKSVSEVRSSLEELRRETNLNNFLAKPENADFKEFEGKIREVAKRPEAKGLTPAALANLVVPKDYWLKKGAEIALKAANESVNSYNGGNSTRSVGGGETGGLPDPNTLSKDEFEKQAWAIARGN